VVSVTGSDLNFLRIFGSAIMHLPVRCGPL